MSAQAAPSSEPADRLQQYARYMAVVAGQLEALRSHDRERIRELRQERLELESQWGEPAGEGNEVALSRRIQEALLTGLEELENGAGTEDLQQERVRDLTTCALKLVRRLRTRPQYRYGGRYPELAAHGGSVDLRM